MATDAVTTTSADVKSPTPTKSRKDVAEEEPSILHIERTLSPSMPDKDHMNYDRVDSEVAKYASNVGIIISPEDNARLKKKVDRRVLTIMVFTYFLQALDKGTLSFSSIMGIKEDAHLVGQQYSWLTTCIFLAVLVVEYPTNWIIQRVPIAKYLGANIILWGSTLCLHAACKNFSSLLAVRTFLGVFEACCQPIFIILSGLWYKREEQAAIVSYWYMMNGAQQIVGGLLAYCFTLISSGPLYSWQALFISYGSFSILWGIFVLIYMPDSPMRAKCFSEEDKHLLVERVRSNQTGLQNRVFRKYQVVEALTDPQVWCYCAIMVGTTLPTSGLGAFASIIITSFDFTVLQTQLLAMVLGAYIIIILLSSTWLSKKTGQNLLVMGVYMLPSFIGTTLLMTLPNNSKSHQVGLLISYYIVLSFWSAQTLSMSLLSRNIAGQTKKSTVVAMNFISWAAGNAIGPQVFLAWDAPRYRIAFSVHLACYALVVIAIAILRWHLTRENARRDRLAEEMGREAEGVVRDERLVHSFEDLTDRENGAFRYVF